MQWGYKKFKCNSLPNKEKKTLLAIQVYLVSMMRILAREEEECSSDGPKHAPWVSKASKLWLLTAAFKHILNYFHFFRLALVLLRNKTPFFNFLINTLELIEFRNHLQNQYGNEEQEPSCQLTHSHHTGFLPSQATAGMKLTPAW